MTGGGPGPHISDRKVTVIGAAKSGVAAARLLRSKGAEVFVTDSGAIQPDAMVQLNQMDVDFESGGHSDRAAHADFAVISPGVPSDAPLPSSLKQQGIELYAEIELASWFCEGPIVAVTGSNGKTTTTSIIARMFETAGKPHLACGNIGYPFAEAVLNMQPGSAVVLEVSSFQLDHVRWFKPQVAVILNITPDHLDRYGGDVMKYAASKFRITEKQDAEDALVYNYDDELIRRRVDGLEGRPMKFAFSLEQEVETGAFIRNDTVTLRMTEQEEILMETDEITLKGRHNLYNSLAAAVAARAMEIQSEAVRQSLAAFEGVPHRLEFVREVHGVRYINDSKATNVNSLWYALESLDKSIVLIIGGRDKGNDYGIVRDLMAGKVRVVIAIGESGDRIMTEIGEDVEIAVCLETLQNAVRYASNVAEEGEVVLLSPSCASFDQFENFEERGNTFKRLVAEL